MYEIERYTRTNTLATAAFLEFSRPSTRDQASSSWPRRCRSTARASIAAPTMAASLPARARRPSWREHWECLCPTCGKELQPVPTRESKPLIPTSVYAVNKRDQEELCLIVGAAYGVSPLRFASSTCTARDRRSRTPTRVSPRFSRRDCSTGSRRSSSRMVSRPVTSFTSMTSSKGSCSLSTPIVLRVTRST